MGKRIVISLPDVAGRTVPRTVETTIGAEIKFSLRTRDNAVAAIWTAAAKSEIERVFAAIADGPKSLSHRDLVALSGQVYRLYLETHADNPGDPEAWAAFKAFNRASAEGRILTAPALAVGEIGDDEAAFAIFGENLSSGIDALPVSDSTDALEDRFGTLATWVLAREGMDVDAVTRVALLRQVAAASQDAGWALKRAALGDYTPDPAANRFPPIKREKIGFEDIWTIWEREKKPAASTRQNYRSVLTKVETLLKGKYRDVSLIEKSDLISVKDELLKSGLSNKTVADTYLAVLRKFLSIAEGRGFIPVSPMTRIHVEKGRKAGTRMLPYTDDEVARLLKLAEAETLAYRRWIPLLCATTGARVGEIAQLWGRRVVEEDGRCVIRIAPAEDGGSIKNEGSERTVPLHSAVIASGFLDFAKSKGDGPLFYRKSKKKPDGEGRHASKGPTNHLATWVRENGFNDSRKAPAHALRHWTKSSLAKAKVADSVADALMGHTTPGEGNRYRHLTIESLADAVEMILLPKVKDAAS